MLVLLNFCVGNRVRDVSSSNNFAYVLNNLSHACLNENISSRKTTSRRGIFKTPINMILSPVVL